MISISTAIQESLPMNIIESIAIGLPVVASNVRGNSDLIRSIKNSFLISNQDFKLYANKIYELYCNHDLYNRIRKFDLSDVKKYSLDSILKQVLNIYVEND